MNGNDVPKTANEKEQDKEIEAGSERSSTIAEPRSTAEEKHFEAESSKIEKQSHRAETSDQDGVKPEQEPADLEAQRQVSEDPENLPPPVPVPKSERRGLLAHFSLIPEVEEPKHYRRPQKWFLTCVVATGSIAAPIGSTILISSIPQVLEDLHSTPTIANLSVALYMLSLALFPIYWSSFSEAFGRRTIYIVSFALLILFNVLSAVATSMAMLIVMRILSGGASGSVQAVGAGTIADIWHVHERGNAMSMYYIGALLGPLLAPVIGGGLQLKWGWRSTMWFLVIYSVISWALLIFCLPETIKKRRSFVAEADREVQAHVDGGELARVSSTQSKRAQVWKVGKVLYAFFIEPIKVVQYLQFPAVALTIYYASITFGSMYVLQLSMQAIFKDPPYNFTSIEIGCCYIAASLGYLTCSTFGGKWTDRIMIREAKKAGRYKPDGKLDYHPEDRMRENIWLAAFMFPAGLLCFGWTTYYKVHFMAPLIANYFYGLGVMLVFTIVTTMLTEFMPKRAASAVALNNLCRNIFSGVGGVVAQPLLDAIGPGWTFTAVALLAWSSSVVIWLIRTRGPKWRTTMERRMAEKGL